LEELDFTKFLAQYSTRGRIGYNPIMKYAVLTYANMRGVKSVDRIVELCERDLAFIWLTQGERPQRNAFYDFINQKLTSEILDDLNYQFLHRLTLLKSIYINYL
jgi:transposase